MISLRAHNAGRSEALAKISKSLLKVLMVRTYKQILDRFVLT